MANLKETSDQLDGEWSRLRLQWEETKALWNDQVRWEFEKEFWTPLEQQFQITFKEIERLEQVITTARRKVE